jgi:hypothetical protein
VLTERLGAAGRAPVAVRVLAEATDASSRSAHAGPDGSSGSNTTLWLVDPVDPFRALIAAAAAGTRGDALLVSDPRDAHDVLRHVDAIRRDAPAQILLVGDGELADDEVAWQLDAVQHTPLLPWGGLLPLDGNRIVALYGTPGIAALGALGQQDLDATIVRARDQAAAYDDGRLRVVPGFDVIATVASASAGPLGDYSQRISIDQLRPLVDRARDEGMVVFIDLQPAAVTETANAAVTTVQPVGGGAVAIAPSRAASMPPSSPPGGCASCTALVAEGVVIHKARRPPLARSGSADSEAARSPCTSERPEGRVRFASPVLLGMGRAPVSSETRSTSRCRASSRSLGRPPLTEAWAISEFSRATCCSASFSSGSSPESRESTPERALSSAVAVWLKLAARRVAAATVASRRLGLAAFCASARSWP